MSSLALYPFGLYCNNVQNGAFAYHKFRTADATRHFLNMCIQDRTTKWDVYKVYPASPSSDPLLVVLDHSDQPLFTFRGPGLEDAMELTKVTEGFFSPQDAQLLTGFANGGGPERQATPEATDTPTVKTPKEPKAPKPAPIPKPTGLVSASDIATAMGLDGKQVRDALRKSGTPKPAHGWSFSPQDASKIATVIAAHLKPGTKFTAYKAPK